MQRQRHLKSNNLLTMILIVGCLFIASVVMYKNVIDKTISNKETTIEAFKEEQFNIIWTSLETLHLESEKSVTEVSEKIKADILSLSHEDLEQLEQDMSNDIINDNLHEILSSNIKNKSLNGIKNHMNGIVVMTIDGYIEDFNYYRANNDTNSNVKPWQLAIDKSYNSQLEEDAIEKLLNRNSGIIALESYNLTKNENHIKIEELTYKSLLEVFLAEGLEGLKNYQIFVPYYITDFGDIFGEPDILHGTKIDNNKLIVVQEFNLYDQIVCRHDSLFTDEQIKDVTQRYSDLLRLLYILGISLIASVTALILYLCGVYNKLIIDEYDEEEITEEESSLDSETQDNE